MNGASKYKIGATEGRAGPKSGRRRRAIGAVLLIAVGCLVAVATLGGRAAYAQASSGSIDQILQNLQGQSDQVGGLLGKGSQGPATTPSQTILQPTIPYGLILPPSRLEQIMSARAGTKLEQFGYNQFGIGLPVAIAQMGSVQDGYILGPGDDVIVSLRGQENNEYRVQVDRDGNVVLPRLSPIPAAGRTLAQFRDDLIAAVHRSYVATQAYVSLGNLRQIAVTVTGEVNSPGQRIMTGLSTASDAVLISGGVKKTGSLRNIKILRGGREITVDLYSILTQRGGNSPANLVDGDRIIVPPLGRTVAVTGWVRRPGIFELAPGQSSISVGELISLGGGLEIRGRYRLSVLRILQDGRTQLADLSSRRATIRDSEVLFALPGAQQSENQATLSGGSALAGQYAVNRSTRLSEVLRAPGALGETPYTLFGMIVRKDPVTYLRSLVAITPVAVLKGREDLDLANGDVVRVFSMNEARLLFAVVKTFENRRTAADEALRAPRSAGEQTVSAQEYAAAIAPPSSQAQGSSQTGNAPVLPSGGAAALLQAANSSPNALGYRIRPNTEREDIGELSTMVLGDTGLVPDNQMFGASANGQPGMTAQPGGFTLPPSTVPWQLQAGGQQSLLGQLGAGALQQVGPQNYASVAPSQGAFGGQLGAMNPELQPYYYPYQPRSPLAQNLQEQMVGPNQVPSNQEIRTFGELSRQIGIDPLVLVHFMMDHEVDLDGAVRGPGNYLIGPNVELQDLVMAAGGAAQWADRSGIQVTTTQVDPATGQSVTRQEVLSGGDEQLASYIVRPHDDVRFNQIFNNAGIGSATVQGEVRRTGVYQLVRGEHLSDLLQQAGGLTDVAYPYGAVFLRRSAAQLEREGYRRAAKEIQDQLLVAMSSTGANSKLSPEAFTAAQTFVDQLRNQTPLGRISIVADPAVLATKPQLDPLLEPGDVIFIPQRPSTISVLGEVMQPGSYLYSPSNSPADYVHLAGGYSSFADDDLTFVILPDGTARKVESSWLAFNGDKIPPGSAIVVPRDLAPLNIHDLIIDTSTIFSQLAVAAASIAVISRNN